jgi:hypothetical protein
MCGSKPFFLFLKFQAIHKCVVPNFFYSSNFQEIHKCVVPKNLFLFLIFPSNPQMCGSKKPLFIPQIPGNPQMCGSKKPLPIKKIINWFFYLFIYFSLTWNISNLRSQLFLLQKDTQSKKEIV